MANPAKTAERASALLARANGFINLQLAQRKLTRSGLQQAASWAAQAAELLESAATSGRPAKDN